MKTKSELEKELEEWEKLERSTIDKGYKAWNNLLKKIRRGKKSVIQQLNKIECQK